MWAAFALGRLHADRMMQAGNDANAERASAVAAFTQARSLALAGAPDPWGMAVGSYGEQARLYLATAEQRCGYTDFMNASECANGVSPAGLKKAVILYAEQAARGSASAVQSLRILAEWLMRDANKAAAVIDDLTSQKLLVAYSLALMGDIVNDDLSSATDPFANADASGQLGYADAAQGYKGVRANPILQTLVAAITRHGVQQVEGGDRLAALAYRVGDYTLAQQLVEGQSSVLAGWVRAKLALRRGDTVAAAQAYAAAVKGFATVDGKPAGSSDSSVDDEQAQRLKAEQGVLSLSRGDYIQAFEQFYASGFNEDLRYVAERVLTVDELRAYVDEHLPASATPPTPQGFANFDAEQFLAWRANQSELSFTPADQIRLLLARRMVREGQVAQALGYLADDGDPRNVEVGYDYRTDKPTINVLTRRAWAKAYGDALQEARDGWFANARAKAWFTAATLARQHGMEIMGYEQGPDFAEVGGSFTYGTGRYPVQGSAETGDAIKRDTPQQRAEADLPGPLVTAEERQRYAASEAQPLRTFHYRYVAAEHAERAADDLPPRSQAFAAVLCQATRYVQNDPVRANELYQRYVKQGAAVSFAEDFGRQCVDPDFAAAKRFPYVQAWRTTRHWVHQHLYVPVGMALLAGLALVTWRVRRGRVNT